MKYVRLDVQISPGVSRPVIVAFPDCLSHSTVGNALAQVCKEEMGEQVHVQITSAGDIGVNGYQTRGHSSSLQVGSRATDALDFNTQDSLGFMSPLPPIKRPPKGLKRPAERPADKG